MLREKFYALSLREQRIVTITVPVVVAMLCWLLLLKPMLDNRAQLQLSSAKNQQQLSWMQQNANRVSGAWLSSNDADSPKDQSQLRQVMNQLLKAQNISIQRIQNVNEKDVSYRLDNSDFNNILQLLKSCQDRNIQIVQLQLTKGKNIGKVNTRLTIAIQG
ncbi:MAG: type II secretion system protein M [Pseudomonadales bacterium]|nr:type II secretion system protein M [Pseudomonadales bacterium]NRA18644.1 type II secretion system protein M [Oceanospirillaceae bacterium]